MERAILVQFQAAVPKMKKEKNLIPSLPKGFKDRWGKELALKKKLLKIIEANFLKYMDFYHWKLLQWK